MHVSKRKDYFWNTAAGIINAAEVILMSMIVTRFGKLSDAGILSFAFAVANVLMAIGSFGGRMYQATDINHRFTFKMYMVHRFFALGIMILSLIGTLFIGTYEPEKAWAIGIITFIYMIEVIENCIWGQYQSRDLLYVGAQMFCTRWIVIIAVFAAGMIIMKDMIISLFWGAVAGTVTFLIWVIVIARMGVDNEGSGSSEISETIESKWFSELLKQTFPLFLAGFCSLFINNIPKFAIDRYLNDDIQACYGFVAMPVFVIGLLNQFIYQPVVAQMTSEYVDGDISLFGKNVRKQMIRTAGIMLICVIGAALIGIPVLSIIYHTDLNEYWKELVILQFAGGFLALTGFFNVVLTIMRRQTVILRGYIGATILGIIVLFVSVKYAGTIGASIGYLVVMALLFAYYYLSYMRYIHIREVSSVR